MSNCPQPPFCHFCLRFFFHPIFFFLRLLLYVSSMFDAKKEVAVILQSA
jgi:hypothetical protein